MAEQRRKKLNRGTSYTRLHGIPPRDQQVSLNSSSSHPSIQSVNRPRVHFRDDLITAITQRGQGGDPELEEVMRQYGLQDTNLTLETNIPKRPESYSEHTQRLAAFGVSLSNRLSHFVFAYPFIVIRRQCQVNHVGKKYHLLPLSLVSVALNMQRAQGITCLWKGIGSYFVVSVMSVSAETALSELPSTKLPRELSSNTSLRSLVLHFALKACSMIIVLPFYSAHLVESVQSEMVSETPGIFSCVLDGFRRLFGGQQTQRMLPLYRLLLPTLGYSMTKYVMAVVIQQLILKFMQYISRRRQRNLPPTTPPPTPVAEKETSLVNIHYPELLSSLLAELITDIIMFPMETAVNRITIQGTRTIIDNTDSGRGFLPVSSRYEGFWDCLNSTVSAEGYAGLYRGFGALMLQYTLRYTVARLTKFILTISC